MQCFGFYIESCAVTIICCFIWRFYNKDLLILSVIYENSSTVGFWDVIWTKEAI